MNQFSLRVGAFWPTHLHYERAQSWKTGTEALSGHLDGANGLETVRVGAASRSYNPMTRAPKRSHQPATRTRETRHPSQDASVEPPPHSGKGAWHASGEAAGPSAARLSARLAHA